MQIFKSGKQSSEQVSTIELASELLELHRKGEPKAKLEIKARVKKVTKDGIQSKTKAGKDSLQWVNLTEYYRRLDEANLGGLF